MQRNIIRNRQIRRSGVNVKAYSGDCEITSSCTHFILRSTPSQDKCLISSQISSDIQSIVNQRFYLSNKIPSSSPI